MLLVACGGDEAAPTSTSAASATPTAVSVPLAPTAISLPAATDAPPATSTPAPAATLPERKATLEVRVTDAPPEGVTKILLIVSQIDVHQSGSDDDTGWQTIVAGPVEFDLVQITGIEEVLGDKELDSGRYGQVRLNVDKAEVTLQDGKVVNAKVPSGRLKVVGGFTLEDGENTILTLDFDAARSVVVAGPRNVLIKPVIKPLVRDKGADLSEARRVGETDDEALPTATPTKTPVPSPTATSSPTPETAPVPLSVNADMVNFAHVDLTLEAGTTVIWTNLDSAPHTVTSGSPSDPDPGSLFDSGAEVADWVAQGGTYSFTFNEAGVFPYYCRVHGGGMSGTVTVNAAG